MTYFQFCLAVILTLPIAVIAGEVKSHVEVGIDRGWNICHALVRDLRSAPRLSQSIVYGDDLPLLKKSFQVPDWKNLDVKEYLDVIYAIEKAIQGTNPVAQFEEWRADFQKQKEEGKINPRLRMSSVQISTSRPQKFMVSYIRDLRTADLCRLNVNRGVAVHAIGDHIFIYDADNRKIIFIYPKVPAGTDSRLPYKVEKYDSISYLFWTNPLWNAATSVVASRIEEPTNASDGTRGIYYVDPICTLKYHHDTRPANKD